MKPGEHIPARCDGGNAFPTADGYSGMSLRDWFAGMALTGMLAQSPSGWFTSNKSFSDAAVEQKEPSRFLAESAYSIADAMLAERSKSK